MPREPWHAWFEFGPSKLCAPMLSLPIQHTIFPLDLILVGDLIYPLEQ